MIPSTAARWNVTATPEASRLFGRHILPRFLTPTCDRAENAECNAPNWVVVAPTLKALRLQTERVKLSPPVWAGKESLAGRQTGGVGFAERQSASEPLRSVHPSWDPEETTSLVHQVLPLTGKPRVISCLTCSQLMISSAPFPSYSFTLVQTAVRPIREIPI
jgi:hypothetical protein